jgi:hypothetical protein
MVSVTTDGIWTSNRIYWTFWHTACDFTSKITITHRLVFPVAPFAEMFGNNFNSGWSSAHGFTSLQAGCYLIQTTYSSNCYLRTLPLDSLVIKVKVTLRLTVSQSVSQSVSLGVESIPDSWPDINYFLHSRSCLFGPPSLTRGQVCLLSELLSAVISHLSQCKRYLQFYTLYIVINVYTICTGPLSIQVSTASSSSSIVACASAAAITWRFGHILPPGVFAESIPSNGSLLASQFWL